MATTNNRSWKALLPRNGGIGVCPQIGRVKIPPVCPRSTLNLTGGRRIKTVRACWFEGDEARFVSLMPSTGRIRKELEVVPEKLRTLDHGRPWSDDQFASTRLSSSRDMSR